MKVLSLIIFLCFSISAQNLEKCTCSKKDDVKVREHFNGLENQNKLISECQSKISPDVKRIRVSIDRSTVIRLVLAYYPKFARQNKIFGTVEVEVIFDEEGFVIYAKAKNGNKIFWNSAEKAVCFSRFVPVLYCGVPVKQKQLIRYNFIL